MKVAVITPYYKPRRDWLEKCHQSVLQQTHPCTHILVGDGCAEDYLNDWDIQHITLQKGCRNSGDTPRGIGSVSAIGQGFEAIAYLDDDNWYHPQHIESLMNLHQQTQASICVSHRLIVGINDEPIGECPLIHPDYFVDTNCYFITESAFTIALSWSRIPDEFSYLDDRLILLYIKQKNYSLAFSEQMTIAYRTKFPIDYIRYQKPIPSQAYPKAQVQKIVDAHEKFFQLTGIDLNTHPVRPYRVYDGTFWDGSISR